MDCAPTVGINYGGVLGAGERLIPLMGGFVVRILSTIDNHLSI